MKGIRLEKKKKPGDDIKISLGPLDRVRFAPGRQQRHSRGPVPGSPALHAVAKACRASADAAGEACAAATVPLHPLSAARRDAWIVPPRTTITQRAFVFAFLAMWSLYQSAQSGPAFQARPLLSPLPPYPPSAAPAGLSILRSG